MKSPMFDYIYSFADQLKTGYQIGNAVELPKWKFSNILLCGMGGSAIGGDLLANYLRPTLKVPFLINRGYLPPNWVDDKTLVIFSSYSGNTAETLSCVEEASKTEAQLLAICSGGELEARFSERGLPYVKIPGGLPPRAALGYSFASVYAVFERWGLTPPCDFMQVTAFLEQLNNRYSHHKGQPYRLANSLIGKIPVFYADVYRWEAVVLRFRCQLAENAKNLAFGNIFPELNHNEIVGWGIPQTTVEDLVIVFIWDENSDKWTIRQMLSTKELLKKEGIQVLDIEAEGENPLARMLSLVHFADWLSYHLAILNEVDPIPIKRIDALKKMQ